ncbi:ankyrin [Aureobasidium pullulans]|nr:ankyrin [Aureobasidium pullulans]
MCMFEAIHHKIERAQFHGRDADQVGRCISQCSSAITSLQLKLHKFEEGGPQDKFGRLKEIGHRLQYPFEKTTLLEIKANVSEIRADLTEAMAILQMDISLKSYQETEEVGQQITQTMIPGIHDLQVAEMDRAAQEERNAILTWLNTLSPSTFTDRHVASFERRKQGTGLWMFEEETMKQWLDGTVSILWCPGDPGSGKSVAMSIVVEHLEHLRAKENIAVAYTYCVYNQEHQTAANFLASLLAQFALQSAELSTDLTECWKIYHRKLAKPSSPEYVRLLRAVRGQFRKSYILVDALDEFPETERQSLIRDLKTFTPDIQILVTSRNVPSIQSHFQDAACMQIRAREEDVRIALVARIEDEKFLSSAVNVNPTLRDDIINAITQKTEGMFLIAELHITALSQEDNVRDVREKLENLPSEIADTYTQTMARIDNQKPRQAERARQVLCWLTHACRPLQVRELQQALAVRPTDKEFVHGGETSIDALLSYCMGLVIVDKQSSEHPSRTGTGEMTYASVDIVRYVHYTAQEFFNDLRCRTFPEGHYLVAQTCLNALLLSNFNIEDCLQATGRGKIGEESSRLLVQLDLSVLHVTAGFGITSMLEDALEMLHEVNVDVRDSNGRTPLHWACKNGHYSTMSTLLELGADKTAVCRDENSPLHFALESDNQKLIMELLDGDGDAEPETVLEAVIYRGHHAVLKVLLGKVQSEQLGFALVEAAIGGEESTVRLIVEAMDPLSDYRDHFSMALLSLTRTHWNLFSKASFSMMDLLLESGADPNFDDHTSYWASTPLSCAAMSLDAVMYLIEQGALVNFRDHLGRTVLHSPRVNCETATFFIARGADVNNRDLVGSTPLHAAVAHNPEILNLLLEHHAKVDAQDYHGMTALNAIMKKGRWVESETTSLEYLLQYGASVDLENDKGHIPLRYAVSNGDWTTCETLLMCSRMNRDRLFLEQLTSLYGSLHRYMHPSGTDEDLATTVECRTRFEAEIADHLRSLDERNLHANKDLLTLDLPCRLGMHSVVRRFLEAGADLKPEQEFEPLVMMLLSSVWRYPPEEDSVATLELLLDHGLSIDALDERGTNLCMAIVYDLPKLVAMLLRRGANLDIGGSFGSPLMIAACGKHRQLLELLLENRIDVNRAYGSTVYLSDCDFPTGMTALHMCAASENSSESDLRLLISYGADLEAKNADGDTPLILAVRCGRLQTTAALLAAGADTSGSYILTKQDRIPGAYEIEFHKALRLVQEAHDQRTALEGDG